MTFMDEVTFNERGNQVKMVKRLQADGASTSWILSASRPALAAVVS